jgi:hypothetical protein
MAATHDSWQRTPQHGTSSTANNPPATTPHESAPGDAARPSGMDTLTRPQCADRAADRADLRHLVIQRPHVVSQMNHDRPPSRPKPNGGGVRLRNRPRRSGRFPGRLYPVTVTAQPLHILQRVRTTPRTVHNVIKLQALSRPTLHAPQLQLPLRLTAELLPLIAVIPIIAIRHSIIPPMILIQDHVEPLRISKGYVSTRPGISHPARRS